MNLFWQKVKYGLLQCHTDCEVFGSQVQILHRQGVVIEVFRSPVQILHSQGVVIGPPLKYLDPPVQILHSQGVASNWSPSEVFGSPVQILFFFFLYQILMNQR